MLFYSIIFFTVAPVWFLRTKQHKVFCYTEQDCPQCAGCGTTHESLCQFINLKQKELYESVYSMFVSKFRYVLMLFLGCYWNLVLRYIFLWLSVEGVTNILLAQTIFFKRRFQLCYSYPCSDSKIAKKCTLKINRSGKNCLETSFQCVIDITVDILCVQCTYSDLICNKVG